MNVRPVLTLCSAAVALGLTMGIQAQPMNHTQAPQNEMAKPPIMP